LTDSITEGSEITAESKSFFAKMLVRSKAYCAQQASLPAQVRLLVDYKWYAQKSWSTYYAVRNLKQKSVLMHREVIGTGVKSGGQ